MVPDYFAKPYPSEHAAAFGKYIALVPAGDAVALLEAQLAEVQTLVAGMSEGDALAVHAPYTWSVKQVLGHVIDCERIFGYRALRIARNDATPLPGFDENAYMTAAGFNETPFGELVDEFAHVRRGHIAMFRHLPAAAWLRTGSVIGSPASARAFLYIMAGHARHHVDILHKRLGR